MRIWSVLAGATAIVCQLRRADACDCAQPKPVCEVFWATEAVFTGKVTQINDATVRGYQVTFAVTQSLRGTLATTEVVDSGGPCPILFKRGEQYLVYAHREGGRLRTGACSHTKELRDATDDLAYLHALPKRANGVVEGEVVLEAYDETTTIERTNRPGVQVVARGTSYATRSDRNGHFKLELPPGKSYTLDVLDPGTTVMPGKSLAVTLPDAAACARLDIHEILDGRIRGRIVDHRGKPVAHVDVEASSTTTAYQANHHGWPLVAKTDADGRYEITGVPIGPFVVLVAGPDARQPVPTTYYPGGTDLAKAKPIAMVRSGMIEPIDFALPTPRVRRLEPPTIK